MLSRILSNLQFPKDLKILILIDDGIAEYLKWNDQTLFQLKILSFHENPQTKKVIELYRPQKILCFLSIISEKIIKRIHELQSLISSSPLSLSNSEIILLTTFSKEIMETFESFHSIVSSKLRIIYLPLHTINLLQSSHQHVGLFNLSSPSCRRVFPILLHHLGEIDGSTLSLNNKRISKIHQIAAEDIPLDSRHGLKLLAHELAGSLVFDLGLDPTGAIFAAGKTSNLVGHTLQPLLSTLSQQRSAHSHEGYNLLKCDEESQSPLKNCTLVLIDRTIDLFTPTAHDPSPPLAHRVLCTLQKAKNASLDVSLTQPLTSVLYPEDGESASDPLQMNSPLSAVSALPIHITPSIAPPFTPAACADDFMNAMFAMSEESGKTILYEELRKTVTEAQGTLPPSKKRGIGAELLGLVNAIISSPSSNSLLPSLSHNEELCVESSGLLSWCLALIDSLQRSSTKQLQAHLTSLLAPPMGAAGAVPLLQCLSSYEMKSTRERVLLSSLTQQHQLSLLSYPIITEIILESCGLTPGSSTSSSCSFPPSGVVDLEHLFQMLLGAFSLMESIIEPEQSSERHLQEAVAMIRTALTTYLINFWSLSVLSSLSLLDFCCSPITEATRLKLLREEILKDIAQYRALCMETETTSDDLEEKEEIVASLRQRLQLEVEDIVLNFVDILREISSLRSSSLPSPLSSSTTAPSASVSAPRDEIFTFSINDSEEALPSLTSVPKHRVVKRAASEENRKQPGSPEKGSATAPFPFPTGIVSKITSAILKERNHLLSGRPVAPLSPQLVHIENPIFSIARAGLGILSQGFGRLGLASGVAKESHPAQHPILVIFVIGGVSVLEVKQVQEVLNSDSGYDQTQVLIGSNNLCSPADLYENIWTPASYLAHQ